MLRVKRAIPHAAHFTILHDRRVENAGRRFQRRQKRGLIRIAAAEHARRNAHPVKAGGHRLPELLTCLLDHELRARQVLLALELAYPRNINDLTQQQTKHQRQRQDGRPAVYAPDFYRSTFHKIAPTAQILCRTALPRRTHDITIIVYFVSKLIITALIYNQIK